MKTPVPETVQERAEMLQGTAYQLARVALQFENQ
jgi:hypothetical protein